MSKELDYLDKILNYQPLTLVERTIIECIKEKIHRLESIDNSNPSEALENLKYLKNLTKVKDVLNVPCWNESYEIVEKALLKAQEPKQYIKWEDLEFDVPTSLPATIKVKMGDTQYLLSLRVSLSDVKSVVLRDNNLKPFLHLFEKEKQFFNDLHLERVEE